jgi:hypothetical protein
MNKPRTPIPDDISAEVMFQHDRTCCVCGIREFEVQIHHIDDNPTNHAIDNLAVLCLDHHQKTQLRGGFAKQLKAADVIRFRSDWVRRVSMRRDKADQIVIAHMTGTTPKQLTDEDWDKPSEAKVIGLLNALPSLRRATIAQAQPRWDTGISSEMRQGSYDAIELLERAWRQLARFYPPDHFGGRPADQFLSEFISGRFAWHRRLCDPFGPGSSGTIVHEIVGGLVLDDIANAIAETVEGLFIGLALMDFDLRNWRSEWDLAGRPNQPP